MLYLLINLLYWNAMETQYYDVEVVVGFRVHKEMTHKYVFMVNSMTSFTL